MDSRIFGRSIMNHVSTVMVAILVALATTTGLLTALTMMGQTASAAGKSDITGGCDKGGCGDDFKGGFGSSGTTGGCGKTGCGGTVDSGGQGQGASHCGFGFGFGFGKGFTVGSGSC